MRSADTIDQQIAVKYRTTVTSLAVDHEGRYACLGGKKGLYIVDLNEPWDGPFKTLYQRGKWGVGRVQWNASSEKGRYIASSANTNMQIWNIDDARFALQGNFRAHSRPVLDFSWNPHDANILGTASADPQIILWDLRSPKKPQQHICINSRAPSTQVEFNKRNQHLLASASEGVVKIWDSRKYSHPVSTITAHMTKISGLDWHPTKENELLTCGFDRRVKWWDMNNAKTSKGRILSDVPFTVVKFTPFGDGIITCVSRTNALTLWTLSDLTAPVHIWSHTYVTEALDWRIVGKGSRQKYQIVSWSRDQHLRFWKITEDHMQACGVILSAKSKDTVRRVSSFEAITPEEFNIRPNVNYAKNLAQELEWLQRNPIVGIELTQGDSFRRTCTATVHGESHVVHLSATFPFMYPFGAPPSWNVLPSSTISAEQRYHLKLILSDVADKHVANNQPCIAQCLAQLYLSIQDKNLEKLEANMKKEELSREKEYQRMRNEIAASLKPSTPQKSSFSASEPDSSLSPYTAAAMSEVEKNMPCPPLFGASFSPNGALVTFQSIKRGKSSEPAPRTYADLKTLIWRKSEVAEEKAAPSRMQITKLYFYDEEVDLLPIQLQLPRTSASSKKEDVKKIIVRIRDMSCLMPVSHKLARNYVLTGPTVPDICRKNAAIAKEQKQFDLVRTWHLLEHISNPLLYRLRSRESLTQRVLLSTTNVVQQPVLGTRSPNSRRKSLSNEEAGLSPLASPVAKRKQTKSKTPKKKSGGPHQDPVTPPAPPYPVSFLKSKRGKNRGHGTPSSHARNFLLDAFTTTKQYTAAAEAKGNGPGGDNTGTRSTFGGSHLQKADVPRTKSSEYFSTEHSGNSLREPGSISQHITREGNTTNMPSTAVAIGSATPPQDERAMRKNARVLHSVRLAESVLTPWAYHPFGRKLIDSLVQHYIKQRDVQTVSMIICIAQLTDRVRQRQGTPSAALEDHTINMFGPTTPRKKDKSKTLLSAMSLRPRKKSTSTGTIVATATKITHVEYPVPPAYTENLPRCNDINAQEYSLMDPEKIPLYDHVRHKYAELLYFWGELNARMMVLRSDESEKHEGIEPAVICWNCKHGLKKRVYCNSCKTVAFRCVICHLPVKGLSSFCLACGHGGHTKHMEDWFQKHDICPSGCGCRCIEKNKIWGDPLLGGKQ